MIHTPDISLLTIDADHSTLHLKHGGLHTSTHQLPFGYASLPRQHHWHTPPREDEIEYAINTIEDVLAKIPDARQHSAGLLLSGEQPALLHALMQPSPGQGAEGVKREAVEHLFGRLANVIMGRPASVEGVPTDTAFAATLLILREVLHHLDFAWIDQANMH
ncbi:hypothetical protein [Uliginosibacterium gangwonense]|uniref:hypothetical protein n=1 Tax=Uliginosibacterium gangwonense TaxID=392736 RepID=UPI00035F2EAE|nr:hypothetical protein [Uliginosibacterium gangwonense]